MNQLHVISAFCKAGQKLSGVELGSTSLLKYIKNPKYIDLITNFENEYNYVSLNNLVKKSLADSNYKTCILGGDHSICSATIPAFFDTYKENGHVLCIDAHADINTIDSSPSGNSHGMPLAKAFGLEKNIVFNKYKPNFKQLTYLGLEKAVFSKIRVFRGKNIE